jgi:hypothetical protein
MVREASIISPLNGAEWVIAQACPLFVFDLITPLGRVRPLRLLTMTGRRRPIAVIGCF